MDAKITERRLWVVTGERAGVTAVVKGDGVQDIADEWCEIATLDEDGDLVTARLRVTEVLQAAALVRECMSRGGDGRDFCREHGLAEHTGASGWECPTCHEAKRAAKAAKDASAPTIEERAAAVVGGSTLTAKMIGGVPVVCLSSARDGDAS